MKTEVNGDKVKLIFHWMKRLALKIKNEAVREAYKN
jgi:hypothetical protein